MTPLTHEAIVQAAEPPNGEPWGDWLTADYHSREVLGCEYLSPEWEPRQTAYVQRMKRGADDWVPFFFGCAMGCSNCLAGSPPLCGR